ncbi:uncharacterized protein LOC108953770 isoform X1 [Musa acuminata AAA Group]|uniref:uncharacterized protein LOC108953770 isoform X1 n=1 Tax=Musa acuminata AAA Group TaxID=214697 RepID=UPI0031E3E8E6
MSLKGLQFWFSLNFKLLCLRSVRKFKVSFYKWVLRRCRQITLLKAAFGISMLYSSHNSILLMIHMILLLGDTYLKIMLRESSLFLNLVDMDPKGKKLIRISFGHTQLQFLLEYITCLLSRANRWKMEPHS